MARTKNNSGMVFVACKLPHGLILHFQDKPETVELLGTNAGIANTVGGFGITEVDGDFMGEWMSRNAELPPVKNGFIIVGDNRQYVEAQAMEKFNEANGLEPIDTKKAKSMGVETRDDKA